MGSALALGFGAGLAFILVLAGLAKLSSASSRAGVGVRAHPIDMYPTRRQLVTLGTAEVLLSAGLFSTTGRTFAVTSVLVAALFSGFFAWTVLAYRKGVPCGCVGRSERPANLLSVGRGLLLLVAAWWQAAYCVDAQQSLNLSRMGMTATIAASCVVALFVVTTAMSQERRTTEPSLPRYGESGSREDAPLSSLGPSRRYVLSASFAVVPALALSRYGMSSSSKSAGSLDSPWQSEEIRDSDALSRWSQAASESPVMSQLLRYDGLDAAVLEGPSRAWHLTSKTGREVWVVTFNEDAAMGGYAAVLAPEIGTAVATPLNDAARRKGARAAYQSTTVLGVGAIACTDLYQSISDCNDNCGCLIAECCCALGLPCGSGVCIALAAICLSACDTNAFEKCVEG